MRSAPEIQRSRPAARGFVPRRTAVISAAATTARTAQSASRISSDVEPTAIAELGLKALVNEEERDRERQHQRSE